MKCDHSVWEPNRFPGGRSRERGHARIKCRGTVEVGRWNIPMDTQRTAMGIDWIVEMLVRSTTFTVVRRTRKPVLILRTGQKT